LYQYYIPVEEDVGGASSMRKKNVVLDCDPRKGNFSRVLEDHLWQLACASVPEDRF
jgi:hypothetical protein